MATLKNLFAGCVLILWTAFAGYASTAAFLYSKALENVTHAGTNDGSYDYKGVNFLNATELQKFIRQEQLEDFFPWTTRVPIELVPMALSMAVATVGGVVAALSRIVVSSRPPHSIPYVSQPLFGAAIGLMLFMLTFLIPSILTTGDSPSRAESIAAISFFGGLFSSHTFRWVEGRAKSYFGSNETAGEKV